MTVTHTHTGTIGTIGRCRNNPPRLGATSLWRGQRIGLLGGSFNPAHDGHRHISLQALKHLDLDWIWWLVSPQNPLKSTRGMAPQRQRINRACQLVNHPRILVTSLESELGTRYTADTLQALTRRFPQARFVWLMGADNLIQISHWQNWTSIFQTVPVAVLARSPYSLRAVSSIAAKRYQRRRVSGSRAAGLAQAGLSKAGLPAWTFLPIPLHAASATAIRAASAAQPEGG